MTDTRNQERFAWFVFGAMFGMALMWISAFFILKTLYPT